MFKKLGLRAKLIISFLAVCLILVIVGIVGIFAI